MMSCGYYSWIIITVFLLAGRTLQFFVRDYLGVCVFGIHKFIHLDKNRTLGEYV
jgi:hypothetical protein